MKFLSRKFIMSIITICLSSFLPLLYRGMGISDAVTISVLAIIGSVVGVYHVANVKAGANAPDAD